MFAFKNRRKTIAATPIKIMDIHKDVEIQKRVNYQHTVTEERLKKCNLLFLRNYFKYAKKNKSYKTRRN